jgi:putative transposase
MTATDFLSVEVHTIKGLMTYYILFFIDIASRSVHIAGSTPHPDSRWMTQIARNLTDTESGFLRGVRYLILDRDTKYSAEFRSALDRERIHLSKTASCGRPLQSRHLAGCSSASVLAEC